MPKSKTKKMRQWAAQKGKRGKIRQRMTIPTRRLTIRRPHRKPQQRQGQIPLQPLQVGPSVKTTQRLLQLSNHHALRGDYTKSAVAFAAATASAAALGVKHPLSTPTPMVPPKHDHLSGPGANIFPGYFNWQTYTQDRRVPKLSRKARREDESYIKKVTKKNTRRTRRRQQRQKETIRRRLATSRYSRNPALGKLNYRRGKRKSKTRRTSPRS
jgi:hypothetical protein